MNIERLKEILEAYGADPKRWPEGERGEAIALLARAPELESAHAEARRLDAVLDTAGAVGDLGLDSARVAGRITGGANVIAMRPKRPRFAGVFAGAWPGFAGLAAAAAAGLIVGWLGIGGEYFGMDNGALAADDSGQVSAFVPTEGEPW